MWVFGSNWTMNDVKFFNDGCLFPCKFLVDTYNFKSFNSIFLIVFFYIWMLKKLSFEIFESIELFKLSFYVCDSIRRLGSNSWIDKMIKSFQNAIIAFSKCDLITFRMPWSHSECHDHIPWSFWCPLPSYLTVGTCGVDGHLCTMRILN